MSQLNSPYFDCHELGDGIYAAIITEGSGSVGNAGFVDLGDATLIFDTFMIPEAAVELKQIAEEMTGNRVKYVINSHFHGDHVNGNQAFSDATIISTPITRSKMIEMCQQRDPKRMQEEAVLYFKQLQQNIDHAQNEQVRLDFERELHDKQKLVSSIEGIMPTYPELTLDNQLTIHGSKRSIELHHLGQGHSPSDTVMYIPSERVIFTGDLIFNHSHPWMGHGNPKEWLTILNRLNDFDFAQLVPGHGKVGDQSQVKQMYEYISELIELVQSYKQDNLPIEEALKLAVPQKYVEWSGRPVFQWNISFLYNYLNV